jgi:prepilin-type N-terminal cleavage/methylation domain-containing protein
MDSPEAGCRELVLQRAGMKRRQRPIPSRKVRNIMKRSNPKAFTLIELLIVVAIIAILAAIAVPNFLEAQTRAKVSCILADMRTNAVAIEAYQVDYNDVMGPGGEADNFRNFMLWVESRNPFLSGGQARRLTTPIAYLSQVTPDVFNNFFVGRPDLKFVSFGYVHYGRHPSTDAIIWQSGLPMSHIAQVYPGRKWRWKMQSSGPDLRWNRGPDGISDAPEDGGLDGIYDPTNGTISAGDVYYMDMIGLVGGGVL